MIRSAMDIIHPIETGAMVLDLEEVGTIVSIFDKAVNISVSERRLVSVVRHAAAMTPVSILCPEVLDSKNIRMEVGQTVNFSGDHLTSCGWGLNLNGSKRFEGFPVKNVGFDFGIRRIERFEKILQLVGQKGGLKGIAGSGERHNVFARKGQAIAVKILSQGRTQLALNLTGFAGLGPGFTPSGDDLIMGFLMGESLALSNAKATPSSLGPLLNRNDRDVLLLAADGTNDAGRALIRMALMDRFPRFLCRAAAELCQAETAKEMLDMVTQATQFGHTSGTDALTGLLLYLKTRLGIVSRNRLDINESKHNYFSG